MHKFQPPALSRNKLPQLSNDLIKINLEDKHVSACASLTDSGAYNGSIVYISSHENTSELIIHADPKIILYSERIIDPPKCDLSAEYGL